ncbi:MAG: cytochrome C oxidase subunit II, partial [Bacteroidia bacterium]|nr:cytochrome C oxidase subunit II [Bacteroidia bacterium]
SSNDVVHGFNIRKTNINLMAIPGSVNRFSHTFADQGLYEVICHEYCGVGHQNMLGQIIVE